MSDCVHSLEEDGEDLLKGIIDHPEDDDDLGGDDDSPHIDDFDVDGEGDEVALGLSRAQPIAFGRALFCC